MQRHFRGLFDGLEGGDDLLSLRCALVLSGLSAAADDFVVAALANPRQIHRLLYYELSPDDCPEAAGNYRGSNHPALKHNVVAYSFNEGEGTTKIAAPHEVGDLMIKYGAFLRRDALREAATVEEKLTFITPIIVIFGMIHPFADGNGHIQRMTFQCLLERAGFAMAPTWRVHPCPYGEDVHRAFAALDFRLASKLLRPYLA